jgi:hypothetical protein
MVKHTYTLPASVETSTGIDIGIGGTPTYVQGEDVTLQFTVYETTDHETSVDVSAATGIEWVLTDGDGSESLTKTQSGGGISFATDGTDGVIDVAIASADPTGLPAELVEHQLTITDDGSGNQTVVARGEFQITESLT